MSIYLEFSLLGLLIYRFAKMDWNYNLMIFNQGPFKRKLYQNSLLILYDNQVVHLTTTIHSNSIGSALSFSPKKKAK